MTAPKRNRWFAATVAAFALAGAAHAQSDPARVEAAKALVASMGGASQVQASIAQLQAALAKDMGERVPDKAKELADYLAKESGPDSERVKNFVASVDEAATNFYAERFTADELKAIAAFQGSEAGRKFQQVTPQLAAIVGPKIMEFQKKLIDDLQIAFNQPQWPGKPPANP